MLSPTEKVNTVFDFISAQVGRELSKPSRKREFFLARIAFCVVCYESGVAKGMLATKLQMNHASVIHQIKKFYEGFEKEDEQAYVDNLIMSARDFLSAQNINPEEFLDDLRFEIRRLDKRRALITSLIHTYEKKEP